MITSGEVVIFLQGSYGNDTNIFGNSDVDIVVELTSAFWHNAASLPPASYGRFAADFPGEVAYGWDAFYADVLGALKSYYNMPASTVVTEGKKAIRVAAGGGRLPADVIPCLTYKHFFDYEGHPGRSVKGIKFRTREVTPRDVINYPHHHMDRGHELMRATDNRYKPTLRMFKNARMALIDRGVLSKDVSPSYFIEGMLSNVPADNFTANCQGTYANCVVWLRQNLADHFTCQHDLYRLFGTTAETWNMDHARLTVNALAEFWDEY